jgi:hypothetical protein
VDPEKDRLAGLLRGIEGFSVEWLWLEGESRDGSKQARRRSGDQDRSA